MNRIAVLAQGAARSDNRVKSVGAVSLKPDETWLGVAFPTVLNNGATPTVNTGASNGGGTGGY